MKLDVGRKTYEHAQRRRELAGLERGPAWGELSPEDRLRWMQQIVSIAFRGPVFA